MERTVLSGLSADVNVDSAQAAAAFGGDHRFIDSLTSTPLDDKS
jgi:hypothetical protein